MGVIRIELFGGLRVFCGGREVALPGDFPRAPFAYLARNRGLVFGRAELCARLWPDLPEERGRAAMATALWRIRKVPGLAGLIEQPSRGTVTRPARRGSWVDVDAFERKARRMRASRDAALARRLARQAAGLWRGAPFLDVTGEWIGAELAMLEMVRAEVLEAWMEGAEAIGATGEALHAAGLLAEAEPFEEPARALRCRLLASSGRAARAAAEHRAFAAFLMDELGVAPGFDAAGRWAEELEAA
ncbi:MAG: AfsR/SARP family transcriptional regulator [Hasllibacter sp.]